MLYLQSFCFNPFSENTYLIISEQKNCIIVDPGCYSMAEKQELSSFIEKNNLKPVRLINTHCHIDHVLGNPYVAKTYNLIPEIHPLEQSLLDAVASYGHMWGIQSEQQPEAKHTLGDLKSIELDGEVLEILFTPGHAPGEISLYSRAHKLLIAGDVLFHESIGRTDLPGGNMNTLINSIQTQFFVLPDDVRVFPGHGPETTIGHEKQHNPFLIP